MGTKAFADSVSLCV